MICRRVYDPALWPHDEGLSTDVMGRCWPGAEVLRSMLLLVKQPLMEAAQPNSRSFGTVNPPSATMRAKSPFPSANSTNRPVSTIRPLSRT